MAMAPDASQDANYSVPLYFVNSGTDDLGVRLADINGDGLADFIRADGETSNKNIYLNKGDGTGWSPYAGWTIPVYFRERRLARSSNAISLTSMATDCWTSFNQMKVWGTLLTSTMETDQDRQREDGWGLPVNIVDGATDDGVQFAS